MAVGLNKYIKNIKYLTIMKNVKKEEGWEADLTENQVSIHVIDEYR